jgi:thiamine biosynthesis lipoprotein
MKILKRLFLFLIILVLAFPAFSCAEKSSVLDFNRFNTAVHVETHGTVMDAETENLIKSLFSDLENQFDLNKIGSITYQFNNASIGQTLSLTENGAQLLKIAKDCYAFTDGDFNPAVYPLVKLWQFSPNYPVKNFTPPKRSEIDIALENTDFINAELNETERTLNKKGEIEIDLGGIVKGFAADMAAKILSERGHEKGYINVGGSSLFLLKTDTLSIRHPRANADIPSIITVKTENTPNVNVSTSGDYQRYYLHDRITYSHVISPKDGYPTRTGTCSVTVIGADGAFSDAITTAACLKQHNPTQTDKSQLISFLQKIIGKYPSAEIYAVYEKDGTKQIVTNKTVESDFILHDNSYSIIKI